MIPYWVGQGLMELARSSDREVCGFLLANPGWSIVPITNVAKGKSEFEMDHEETIYMYNEYFDQIQGVFHSHPRGSTDMSQEDVRHAPAGMRYFIVTNDSVVEWRIDDNGTRSPYLVDQVSYAAEEGRQAARI